MSEAIRVQTSTANEYNIHLGYDLTTELSEFIKNYSSEKIFVIIDEFVFDHHYQKLKKILEENFSHIHIYKVPRGESSKSSHIYHQIVDFVLTHGVERATPLIAVGGGVTGDLAGFAAATVMRGIPLIHIPTTLLAMVDSSIGGKTGINHSEGKNLVGSFYQPDAVFADVRFLETLPQKEWVNGLSEVLKYGMIDSPEIISWIRNLIEEGSFKEAEEWLPIIKKSAQIKVDIVAQDVLEAGKRAYLNFGHTFAHVIEREGNYERYSHGEAVFAGMMAAVHASNKLGANIDEANLSRFRPLYNLSLDFLSAETDALVNSMLRDKKVKDNQIKLILLHDMGNPYIHCVEERGFVEEAWKFILNIFE